MAKYQNMLVAIDPNQDDQPALRRAVYLHQRIGGKIKAFLPIYDFSYEMTTLLSPDERTAMRQGVISQRTAWIREQAKYYLEAGVPIDIKVVWHNRPFEAIIRGGGRRWARSAAENGAPARQTGIRDLHADRLALTA